MTTLSRVGASDHQSAWSAASADPLAMAATFRLMTGARRASAPYLRPMGRENPTLMEDRIKRENSLTWETNGGQGRDRTGDLPLFRRTLVPTELPGRTAPEPNANRKRLATLTGLEPATSAVTGRRANQLRHRAMFCCAHFLRPAKV